METQKGGEEEEKEEGKREVTRKNFHRCGELCSSFCNCLHFLFSTGVAGHQR